jgi:hypothetical protein
VSVTEQKGTVTSLVINILVAIDVPLPTTLGTCNIDWMGENIAGVMSDPAGK